MNSAYQVVENEMESGRIIVERARLHRRKNWDEILLLTDLWESAHILFLVDHEAQGSEALKGCTRPRDHKKGIRRFPLPSSQK